MGPAAAWIPLAALGLDAFKGNLTVNPIQYATQHLGRDAILLLTISLSITPLETLTGWRQLQRLSRLAGLYTFLYTLLHVILYVVVDYGLALDLLWVDRFADVVGGRDLEHLDRAEIEVHLHQSHLGREAIA